MRDGNGTSTEDDVLAGPTLHHYEYDDYNRLLKADGWYVGPDDRTPDLLKQVYDLNMQYDDSHNITQKKQGHQQGEVDSWGDTSLDDVETMEDTAYTLDYEDYASGNFTTEGYSYVQPHAPRTIVQYPENMGSPPDPGDPAYALVKKQLLDYDAHGNLLSIKQEISVPEAS